MIEKIVYDYLTSVMQVPVFMEIPPEGHDTDFIVIQKTGTSRDDKLDHATFAIRSYGESLFKAASLNAEVKNAMDDIASAVENVTKSTLNTDYNYTDTQTKSYRYQAVYDLVFLEI